MKPHGDWQKGYGQQAHPSPPCRRRGLWRQAQHLRCLASAGCRVTVVPATATAEEILGHNPDGIFLSNGPGDPAATGVYAVPVIRTLIDSGKPIFGICLGHQILALALGARTGKMPQGHHGANHPVKDLTTGKVEITSMNHGFTVLRESLPAGVVETHVSLFDGTNCGIAVEGKPIFSVQYHPEASPGPQDSHYLFERFTKMMGAKCQNAADPPPHPSPLPQGEREYRVRMPERCLTNRPFDGEGRRLMPGHTHSRQISAPPLRLAGEGRGEGILAPNQSQAPLRFASARLRRW